MMPTESEQITQEIYNMFAGLVKAGFSREEALHMVTAILVNNKG